VALALRGPRGSKGKDGLLGAIQTHEHFVSQRKFTSVQQHRHTLETSCPQTFVRKNYDQSRKTSFQSEESHQTYVRQTKRLRKDVLEVTPPQQVFVRQKLQAVTRKDYVQLDCPFHYVKQIINKKVVRPIFIFSCP
jgi:hypothetical protein